MKPLNPLRARRLANCVLAFTFAAAPYNAQAQLRLPAVSLPVPQGVGQLGNDLLADPVTRLGRVRELPSLRELRLDQVNALLRRHRAVLEADPQGEPVVRREILAWNPARAGLAAAAAAGLTVLRPSQLEALDDTLVVLQAPEQADLTGLLQVLRAADPAGSYDYNHLYTGSGAGLASAAAPSSGLAPATGGRTRVGLIDSGVDAAHDVFRGARIERWGCAGAHHPDPHGTAVAALMVGKSAHFTGVAPGAGLYAADIYCNSATGGSADRIAAALAWLAREQIGVINLSIVGPANQTLARVVESMVRRGHLLVAAVGNDGPAAPPLYPASYPGVVGVSAVDKRGRVIAEAGRGKQVMFAAPGNHMVSASVGEPPYRQVRGTSFAAPIVSSMLAGSLARPDRGAAAAAVAALARKATRAHGEAVSNETGLGVVGQEFRIDPSALR